METTPFTPESVNPVTIGGAVGLLVIAVGAFFWGKIVPGSVHKEALAAAEKRHAEQIADAYKRLAESEQESDEWRAAYEAMREQRDKWRIELAETIGRQVGDDPELSQQQPNIRKNRRPSP